MLSLNTIDIADCKCGIWIPRSTQKYWNFGVWWTILDI